MVRVAISLVNVVKYRDEGPAVFEVGLGTAFMELDLLGWVLEPAGLI